MHGLAHLLGGDYIFRIPTFANDRVGWACDVAAIGKRRNTRQVPLGSARQAFNDSVLSYNNKAENFPNSIIAGMFSFELASFLEIESKEKREVPDVKFT